MVYSAYEDSVSNKREIEAIKQKIRREEKNINALAKQETDMKNDILSTQGEIQKLESTLIRGGIFSPEEVKACISDFFAGWVSIIEALGKNQAEQAGAQQIYQGCIDGLFK